MLAWSGNGVPVGQLAISALGDLRDRRLVGAHALAVKRRQHQLAPPEVLRALLQQQRLRPEQRPQDDVAARGDRVDAIAGEEQLHRLRVGQEDDVAGAEQPGAERVAEAPAPPLVERDRPGQEARCLQRAGQRYVRRAGPGRRDALRPRGSSATAASISATSRSARPPRAARRPSRRPRRRRLDRVAHAVVGVVGQDPQRDALERLVDGGHLGQHIDAIGLVLDHPPQPADLALDPGQTPQDRVLVAEIPGWGARCLGLHTDQYTRPGYRPAEPATAARNSPMTSR